MQKLKTSWIKLIAMCLAVSACQGIAKPKGHVGVVHVQVEKPYINEFNMETDFNDDLDLKPTAKGVKRAIEFVDLDKGVWLSAESYANSRAAWKKLKKRYENCKVDE